MLFGAAKLLKVPRGPRPVDVWAVGYLYASSGTQGRRPIVFHRSKGGTWSLKYVGAEIPGDVYQVQFDCGTRRADDAAGTLYVSCVYRTTGLGGTDAITAIAAKSEDYGETWSYIPAGASILALAGFNIFDISSGRMGPIISPAAGQIITAVGVGANAYNGFYANKLCYGSTSLELSDVGSLLPDGAAGVGDFIHIAEAESLDGQERLLAASSRGILQSADLGATWSLFDSVSSSGFDYGHGTFSFRPKKRLMVSGQSPALSKSPRVWSTNDMATWDEREVSSRSNYTACAVAEFVHSAAPGLGRWVVASQSLSNLQNLQTLRTQTNGDAFGDPLYENGGAVAFRMVRWLGDRYFGCRRSDATVASSVWGNTWRVESLPAAPGPFVITDVFGA